MEKEILIPEKIKNTLIGLSIQRNQIDRQIELVLNTFIDAREIKGNYDVATDFSRLIPKKQNETPNGS